MLSSPHLLYLVPEPHGHFSFLPTTTGMSGICPRFPRIQLTRCLPASGYSTSKAGGGTKVSGPASPINQTGGFDENMLGELPGPLLFRADLNKGARVIPRPGLPRAHVPDFLLPHHPRLRVTGYEPFDDSERVNPCSLGIPVGVTMKQPIYKGLPNQGQEVNICEGYLHAGMNASKPYLWT